MAKAEPKKTSDRTGHIIDVAHPGQSAPAGNSKAVIVTNRPMIKDPMMVEDAADSETADQSVPVKTSAQAGPKPQPLKKLEPAETAAAKNDAAEAPAEAAKTDETAKEPPKPAPNDAEPAQPEQDKAAEPSETETGAEEDAPAGKDQAGPDIKAAEAAAAEAAKHDAAIDKLADSKQYYLPIDTVEKRRSRRFVALGVLLSLLLITAWADVALDAGIVSNSSNLPHTHFFDRSDAIPSPAAASTSTPLPSNKTYTAPVSQISFRYPNDWTLTNKNQGGKSELFTLLPPSESNIGDAVPTFAVSFSNIAGTSPGSYSVLDIRYTKLSGQIANLPVYLRELVYKSQAGGSNVNIVSSLVNDNSVKTGDVLQNVDAKFMSPPGFPALFQAYAFANNQRKPFGSLADAQTFMKASDYQKAKRILLSTTAVKH